MNFVFHLPQLRSFRVIFPVFILVFSAFSAGAQFQYHWAQHFGGAGTDDATLVETDALGNIYVGGTFEGTVDFDPGPNTSSLTSLGYKDIYLVKLDPSGNLIWAKQIAGPKGDETFNCLKIAPEGSIYLGGALSDSADLDPGPGFQIERNLQIGAAVSGFICIWDANGNLIRGWSSDILSSYGHSYLNGFDFDPWGNILSHWYVYGEADFSYSPDTVLVQGGGGTSMIMKMDSNWAFNWVRIFYAPSTAYFSDLICQGNGNVVVSGRYQYTFDVDPAPSQTQNLVSLGGHDIFLAALDSAGNLVHARSYGNTQTDYPSDLLLDDQGNLYLSGYFMDSIDFNYWDINAPYLVSNGGTDAFICKFDSNYEYIWNVSMGGTGNDYGMGLAKDQLNRIYLTGEFRYGIGMIPGFGADSLISVGSTDPFLVLFDSSGQYLDGFRTGGSSGFDRGNSLICDFNNNVIIAGWYSASAYFDPPLSGVMNCFGPQDGFVAKYYLPLTPRDEEKTQPEPLKVFPNPSKGKLTLYPGNQSGPAEIRISDLAGRTVFQNLCSPGSLISLELPASLAPGMYLLEFRDRESLRSTRFIKE